MQQQDILLEAKLIKYGLSSKLYFLKLKPELFSDPLTQYAYHIIKKYYEEQNELPSMDVLRVELSSNGIAKPAEVHNLINAIINAKNEKDFHQLLKKGYDLHKIREWSKRMNKALEYLEKGKIKQLENMFALQHEIVSEQEALIRPATFKHALAVLDKAENIPTGFAVLDQVLDGGFGKGELSVLIAPPKSAKSMLMMHCWYNAYKKGYKSLLLSLELPETTIEKRLITMLTETKFTSIKHHRLKPEEEMAARKSFSLKLFGKEMKKYYNLPLEKFLSKLFKKRPNKENLAIYSSATTDINDLEREIHLIRPDIIFVDYLSWLEPRGGSRGLMLWERLGLVAKDLKNLARQVDAALVTAAHLNEDTNDIKYSRMVGEHADLVIKWNLVQAGVVNTYKMESVYTRNIAPFDNLFMMVDYDKQKIEITAGTGDIPGDTDDQEV